MENKISEGNLVYLEKCTAASNIAAGRMIGINTGANTLYSYDRESVGFSGTGGGFGVRFIGILDESVSAGQVGVNVWTKGIFEFQLASSIETAATIGHPVWGCISGGGALVTTEASGVAPTAMATGCLPIGTVVGLTNGTSGEYVRVKITPGAFNWGALLSSTGTHAGNNFPPTI